MTEDSKPVETQSKKSKLSIYVIAFAFLALAGVGIYFVSKPVVEVATTRKQIDTFDQFESEMRTSAKQKIEAGTKDNSGVQIIVPMFEFPIGSLIRLNRTIPLDVAACKPAESDIFAADEASTIFTPYSLTKNVALEAGLDSPDVKKALGGKLNLNNNQRIDFQVSGTNFRFLTEAALKKLRTNTACAASLRESKGSWLIQGEVRGQRSFVFATDDSNKLNGNAMGALSFNITFGDGARNITVSDKSSKQLLAVITQIDVGAETSTLTTPTVVGDSHIAGRIYVQRDVMDKDDDGKWIVADLKKNSFPVENQIEAIASNKVPKVAQIRYFNDHDLQDAERVLELLKTKYPDAKSVRIQLPAPAGQMEVPDYVRTSGVEIIVFLEQGVARMRATASLGTIAAKSNRRLNRYCASAKYRWPYFAKSNA